MIQRYIALSALVACLALGQTYSHCRAITISGALVPSPQTNFPLLFNSQDTGLRTAANGGGVANSNGYDVIFAAACDGTGKLNHEIEFFDGVAGRFTAWVNIPNLTSSTVIYLLYGNASISTSQENRTAVWDSNYKGVYHFANSTNLVNDSTGNNNGQNAGGTPLNGQVGGAVSFTKPNSIQLPLTNLSYVSGTLNGG